MMTIVVRNSTITNVALFIIGSTIAISITVHVPLPLPSPMPMPRITIKTNIVKIITIGFLIQYYVYNCY